MRDRGQKKHAREDGTLDSGVSGNRAAEGVADEDEAAGDSSSAHAQNITREAICGFTQDMRPSTGKHRARSTARRIYAHTLA
jgi:hypothetical protein